MANLSPFLTRMRFFFFGEPCHHFFSLFYSYYIFVNTLSSHSFRPRAYRAISSHIRRRWNDEGIWIVIPIRGLRRRWKEEIRHLYSALLSIRRMVQHSPHQTPIGIIFFPFPTTSTITTSPSSLRRQLQKPAYCSPVIPIADPPPRMMIAPRWNPASSSSSSKWRRGNKA